MSSLQNTFSKKLSSVEILLIVGFVLATIWIVVSWRNNKKIAEYEFVTKGDLQRLVLAEERYFAKNGKFISCSGIVDCERRLLGFRVSKDSKQKPELFNINVVAEDGNIRGVFTTDGLFVAVARHNRNEIAFRYDRRSRGFFKTK
jgi:hypothetical protein